MTLGLAWSADFVRTMQPVGVVPVLVGPLQALIAILPGLLVALGGVLLALFKPSSLKKLVLFVWSQKLAVLVIVGVVAGVFVFVPRLFPAAAVSAARGGADWPLWRGSLERRGSALDADDPTAGGVRWRLVDGKINTFYASAAVVGNRVYVTSARYEYFTDKGAVYSLDAATGEVVWKFDADGYRATFSSPAVSGNTLVVGEGLHLTQDSRVFCFDVAASEARREGVVRWSWRTRSHVESSPCIAEDKVVIGAGDDGLYCFKLEADAGGKPVLLWHLEGAKYPDCEASPTLHDGKVYFCLGNRGQAVCCVDAGTGAELWRVAAPYPVFGSPTISGGKIYVGMGTGNYVQTAEEVAAALRAQMINAGKSEAEIEAAVQPLAPVGEVWCIDIETHAVLWKFRVGRTILGAVAVADDRVYFGSRDGFLYCVSTQGHLIDKWNAHAPIVTSPAVARDHVYVVTSSGQLYGLDRKTLKVVWDLELNSESMSSPTVAGGHVYVGTTTNGLLCAGEPAGQREKPVWAGALGGPGRSGWTEGSQMTDRGTFAWRFPRSDDDTGTPQVDIPAPAAYVDGAFYLGMNTRDRSGLARLELTDNVTRPVAVRWFAPSANPACLSAAATEANVYFVDGRRGDTGRKLRCLDPETGAVRWDREVAADATGEFILTRRSELLIADAPGRLRYIGLSLPRSLPDEWSEPVGAVTGMPLVVGEIVIVAVDADPALVALDLRTGRTLWRTTLASPPRTGCVFAGDGLWVGDAEGLVAFDLVSGGKLHEVKCGAVTAPLVSNERVLAAVTDAREMVVLEAETAKEVLRVNDADATMPPVLADDALLYYDGKAVKRLPLAPRAKGTTWFNVEIFKARLTTPMVVVRSNVYFGTDKLGFVCVKPRK